MKLGKKRKMTEYCGKTRYEMFEMIVKLCKLQDDIAMTDEEDEAMTIAIQAMTDIRNEMKWE